VSIGRLYFINRFAHSAGPGNLELGVEWDVWDAWDVWNIYDVQEV